MNSAHKALNNAKVVMDDLSKGGKAVGGTRSVRDDRVLGIIGIEVDTTDKHRGISRRCRDDNFLRATLEVSGSSENVISIIHEPNNEDRSLFSSGEDTLKE